MKSIQIYPLFAYTQVIRQVYYLYVPPSLPSVIYELQVKLLFKVIQKSTASDSVSIRLAAAHTAAATNRSNDKPFSAKNSSFFVCHQEVKYDKYDGRFSFIYVQLKIIVIRKVSSSSLALASCKQLKPNMKNRQINRRRRRPSEKYNQ